MRSDQLARASRSQSRSPHRSSPQTFKFNVLLARAARKSWVQSLQLLQQAKKAYLQPDVVTYTTAASSLASAKRATDASLLLEEARIRQTEPTTALSTAVANAYAGQSCWEQTRSLMENMKRHGPSPNAITFAVALTSCVESRWADALVLVGIARQHFVLDAVCLGATVTACAVSAAWEQGLAALLKVCRQSLRANIIMYSSVVTACENAAVWDAALCLLDIPAVRAAPSAMPLRQ
ncbi:unnamed protein product [Symbiodinium natans]|uniref:Pentatricopeptide repeat-containing protein n=1 Tax=Symbiodinium natans TaxID=878477 RepID=A0A812VAB0_9DINO|nr:unnamed protein product [Symbiodinium natans]